MRLSPSSRPLSPGLGSPSRRMVFRCACTCTWRVPLRRAPDHDAPARQASKFLEPAAAQAYLQAPAFVANTKKVLSCCRSLDLSLPLPVHAYLTWVPPLAQGNTNDMARGIQGAIDAISGLTPMDPNGAFPPLVLIVADGKFAGESGRRPRALRVDSSLP